MNGGGPALRGRVGAAVCPGKSLTCLPQGTGHYSVMASSVEQVVQLGLILLAHGFHLRELILRIARNAEVRAIRSRGIVHIFAAEECFCFFNLAVEPGNLRLKRL